MSRLPIGKSHLANRYCTHVSYNNHCFVVLFYGRALLFLALYPSTVCWICAHFSFYAPLCLSCRLKPFLLLWQKLKGQNIFICRCENFLLLQMWKKNAIWGCKLNQTNLWTKWPVHKVQFWLNLPTQMAKHFNICKSIFFAISTFDIIEEMASGLAAGFLTSICSLLTPPVKMLKLAWVFKD